MHDWDLKVFLTSCENNVCLSQSSGGIPTPSSYPPRCRTHPWPPKSSSWWWRSRVPPSEERQPAFHRSIINLSGLLIHRLLAHQDIIFYTFNPAFTAPDLHHIDRSFSLPSSVFHIWRIPLGTSKRPVVDFGVQILRTFSLSLLGISLGCITTGMAISCSSPFPAAGAGGSAGARAWAEQKHVAWIPKLFMA